MKFKHILLEKFRNHSSTMIYCSQGVNFFLGDNGEGKTNILEGISFLCLSKSIFNASDSVVTSNGEKFFNVSGKIISDSDIEYEIRVSFDKEKNSKSVMVNKSKVEKISDLIGQFPVVVLTPENSSITFGSPAERRKFADFVISQSSRAYLENLLDYRRVLKQRNKILSDLQFSKSAGVKEIEIWNESLVNIGSLIIHKRLQFVETFKGMAAEAYKQVAGNSEMINIFYKPTFDVNKINVDDIKENFKKKLDDQWTIERRIGYSIVGPHRDEFIFQMNGFDFKDYASQGQHKTMLIALKIAEFKYLKEQCKESPILLLDDVLSELDKTRSQRLLEATAELGQIFISSTDERAINWVAVEKTEPKKFYVKQGKIEHIEETIH